MSRRVACGIAALAGLACAYSALRMAERQHASQENAYRAAMSDFEKKQSRAVNLYAFRQQLEEMKDMLRLLLERLPSRFNDDEIQQGLREHSALSGLKIERASRGEETKKEFYAELPYDIRLSGAAAGLNKFFQRLSSDGLMQDLRKLSITARDSQTELSVEATLVYFRYGDADE
jgi:type IV pilus assembly protein PilO